ncbi:hypothetical protein BEN47_18980 [Hymenobacter lapidarius]|uniref:HNH nuclease domain-containing protein n=1 Tax=Hymenobacter lapidarius TaxID=1908237 RepID=A0A1G1SSU2_9BACT|nr:hypothetical protein [Hymenobacter lapidarius]OGX81684.1 hypothetical protein BEN47_18980 [Hymenobacter lapidarius]
MISILRPLPPASLNTPEMKQYVTACAVYAAACAAASDPGTVPPPAKPGGYRGSDVLRAFDTHFFSKCYLTEQWHGSSYEMDVDHFVPVNQNPALKFDWNNLFPAAHKANMMRPRQWPMGGLLDPCRDQIENRLLATIGPNGQAPQFEAANASDQAACNTAELLNTLHNGKPGDEASRLNTRHLRVTIAEQYDRVLHAIIRFQQAEQSQDAQRGAQARRNLRNLLSKKAPFTMLMRAMYAVVEFVPQELLD